MVLISDESGKATIRPCPLTGINSVKTPLCKGCTTPFALPNEDVVASYVRGADCSEQFGTACGIIPKNNYSISG